MKKSLFIMISLAIALFFVGTLEVNAQWCINIDFDDSNCNCGTVTGITLEWELTDNVTQTMISSGSVGLTSTDPYLLCGDESIDYDVQERYVFAARVTYYDPTKCCTGWNSETYDGDELYNGNETLYIIMN